MIPPRPPVNDWSTDFDHLDPSYVEDPYPIWNELRQTCPVAHTDRYQGVWMPTRYEDLVRVANDTASFSSRSVFIQDGFEADGERFQSPPITSDPPEHALYRRLLLPAFAPGRIAALEPVTRQVAAQLIDGLIDSAGCDVAADYAQQLPVTVIARMLGVDEADRERFTDWIHVLLEVGPVDPERSSVSARELIEYLKAVVADHRESPRDDLVGYLLASEFDGQATTDRQVIGMCFLILIAGIDTTWSSIGASLWHLARHPDDRELLVASPELMPVAVEEFLRAYSPVTMAREIVRDAELGGCQLRSGERMLLPFPSANRDASAFNDPDRVILDRAENRHLAFGVGIHRCLGSNLARLELRVALEEWLRRIPSFSLVDPATVTWKAGQVRGPRTLPIRFDRMNRIGKGPKVVASALS